MTLNIQQRFAGGDGTDSVARSMAAEAKNSADQANQLVAAAVAEGGPAAASCLVRFNDQGRLDRSVLPLDVSEARFWTGTTPAAGVTALAPPVHVWDGSAFSPRPAIDPAGHLTLHDLATFGTAPGLGRPVDGGGVEPITGVTTLLGAPATTHFSSAAWRRQVVGRVTGAPLAAGVYRVRGLVQCLDATDTATDVRVHVAGANGAGELGGSSFVNVRIADGGSFGSSHTVAAGEITEAVTDPWGSWAGATVVATGMLLLDFEVEVTAVDLVRLDVGVSATSDATTTAGPFWLGPIGQDIPADWYPETDAATNGLAVTPTGDPWRAALPLAVAVLGRRGASTAAAGTLVEIASSGYTARAEVAANGELSLFLAESGESEQAASAGVAWSDGADATVELVVREGEVELLHEGVSRASLTPAGALGAATGYSVGARGDGTAGVCGTLLEAAVLDRSGYGSSASSSTAGIDEVARAEAARFVFADQLTVTGDGDTLLWADLPDDVAITAFRAAFIDNVDANATLTLVRKPLIGRAETVLTEVAPLAVDGNALATATVSTGAVVEGTGGTETVLVLRAASVTNAGGTLHVTVEGARQ